MSLRWTSHVAPKPPRGGGQKRETVVFQVKSHFAWRKSVTKFLCVKTVSHRVVRHSLGWLSICAKMIGGRRPLLRENMALKNADFQSIFARSASAVTAIEESSINTTGKSTTRFPMSLRWTLYVALKMNSIRWS